VIFSIAAKLSPMMPPPLVQNSSFSIRADFTFLSH
jgi:hypothetical protein